MSPALTSQNSGSLHGVGVPAPLTYLQKLQSTDTKFPQTTKNKQFMSPSLSGASQGGRNNANLQYAVQPANQNLQLNEPTSGTKVHINDGGNSVNVKWAKTPHTDAVEEVHPPNETRSFGTGIGPS